MQGCKCCGDLYTRCTIAFMCKRAPNSMKRWNGWQMNGRRQKARKQFAEMTWAGVPVALICSHYFLLLTWGGGLFIEQSPQIWAKPAHLSFCVNHHSFDKVGLCSCLISPTTLWSLLSLNGWAQRHILVASLEKGGAACWWKPQWESSSSSLESVCGPTNLQNTEEE